MKGFLATKNVEHLDPGAGSTGCSPGVVMGRHAFPYVTLH